MLNILKDTLEVVLNFKLYKTCILAFDIFKFKLL